MKPKNSTMLLLMLSLVSSAFPSGAAESGKATAKKWFPGHYVMLEPDTYTTNNKSYRVLKGADGKLFQGLFMYVTWGQIETNKGQFCWDKIDTLLNGLPPGKKIGFSLSWQGWGRVAQACPGDMIDKPIYDGGQRVRSSHQKVSGVRFATIHMPGTMERYLAFTKAFAARYDSDPRLAFVTTAEIPYEASLKVGQYNEATARSCMYRLAEMVKYFPQTPCGVLGAWWSFGGDDSVREKFARAMLEAGGGFGFPDLDGTMKGGHYNSHFRPQVLANAGRWPCWMGVEWQDLMPERAGARFPDDQIVSANLTKTHFIWWIAANRRKDGGHDFDNEVLPYLRAHPHAGITTNHPSAKTKS
jgi:hypothetical protein